MLFPERAKIEKGTAKMEKDKPVDYKDIYSSMVAYGERWG